MNMKHILTEWRVFLEQMIVSTNEPFDQQSFPVVYQKEKEAIEKGEKKVEEFAQKQFGLSVKDCGKNTDCRKSVGNIEASLEKELNSIRSVLNPKVLDSYFTYREAEQQKDLNPVVGIEKEKQSDIPATNMQQQIPSKPIKKQDVLEQYFKSTCNLAVAFKLVPQQEYDRCYVWMKTNPTKCPSGMRKDKKNRCMPLSENEKILMRFRQNIENWLNNQS